MDKSRFIITFGSDGRPVKNRDAFKAYVRNLVAIYEEEIPSIIEELPDLEEYCDDFLKTINADLYICVRNYNKTILVSLFKRDEYNMITEGGFSATLLYDDIASASIPKLGDYIFEMWNAYITCESWRKE